MLNGFKNWFLVKEAEDSLKLNNQSITLYHGCTTSSANNIINGGLQDRSKFDIATNMAGEFWATNNYHYASLMAFMPGYNEATPENPPVVLQFHLPVAAIKRMKEGKHYESHGLGTYEFKANAFNFLNKQINNWKKLPLEHSAAAKWQQVPTYGT
jgi:hypothetical protein